MEIGNEALDADLIIPLRQIELHIRNSKIAIAASFVSSVFLSMVTVNEWLCQQAIGKSTKIVDVFQQLDLPEHIGNLNILSIPLAALAALIWMGTQQMNKSEYYSQIFYRELEKIHTTPPYSQ